MASRSSNARRRLATPRAISILAHWHIYGSDRPRNVNAARACLERAAEKGNTEAVCILANMTAGGIGCEADWDSAVAMLREIAAVDKNAAEQLALLPEMMSEDDVMLAKRETLSPDPRIELVKQLLSRESAII